MKAGLESMVHRTRLRAFEHISLATITAILLMPVLVSAQDVTSSALKAAFIYNIAKFTDWPADVVPAAEPFVLCVLGDAAVLEALQRAVKDRVMAGHSIAVWLVVRTGPQPTCHVLYVSGIPAGEVTLFVAGLRNRPVLTISDIRGFAELGGIVQLFFQEGQLRFSIQQDSAARVNLQISSKVLVLAEKK
jgi:hypothetical protein